MTSLMEQARRSGAGYVMISGGYSLPGILELPPRLQESGAFEVVHSELDPGTSENHGLVLLKSSGRSPAAVSTQMNASSAQRLRRCEQAKGPGYEKRLRSMFPNGISTG
jgi:hypothetical protein